MHSSFDRKFSDAGNDPKSICFAIGLAFATALLLSLASPIQAAITWSGDLDPIDPTTWTLDTLGIIGKSSTGTITVDGASALYSKKCVIGASSTGTATVTGAGSMWINDEYLSVGGSGVGDLNIKAGGQVSSDGGRVGASFNSTGTATVADAGSKWTMTGGLLVGLLGVGTLNIEAGGELISNGGYLGGANILCTGDVTVTGAGSKWTNNGYLKIGQPSSKGTLTVENGGTVVVGKTIQTSLNSLFGNGTITANGCIVDADLVFDTAHGLQNTLSFGSGGTLTVTQSASESLGVGYKENGTLRITDGVTVACGFGYLGYMLNSNGTATVNGADSKWTSNTLYVGNSGTGTLNIGSGIASDGAVLAKSVILANENTAAAICNLNGGTLQTTSITQGAGSATFNWSDGAIRNFDASTDLTVNGTNNLTLQLAETGTHAFNIDAGRTGTVAAVLCDATSGGTLAKQGDGLLVLSAVNTYTGTTTIESGQLKLVAGGDIAFSSEIINRAGFMIDGGNHSVQKITGSGAIQVLYGSLTAGSIVQDTLTIGGTTNAVPEPASLVLLATFGFAVAGVALRRRER